jgi:hypothetical protein
MRSVWHGWKLGEPFNVCKVGWKGEVVGRKHFMDHLAWYLKNDADLRYSMT